MIVCLILLILAIASAVCSVSVVIMIRKYEKRRKIEEMMLLSEKEWKKLDSRFDRV